MSDWDLNDLIAEMETYLKDTETPDPDYLSEWNAKTVAAIETAERGPEWRAIVERGRALNEVIRKWLGGLTYDRDRLRQELEAQALGQRALKGYTQ